MFDLWYIGEDSGWIIFLDFEYDNFFFDDFCFVFFVFVGVILCFFGLFIFEIFFVFGLRKF